MTQLYLFCSESDPTYEAWKLGILWKIYPPRRRNPILPTRHGNPATSPDSSSTIKNPILPTRHGNPKNPIEHQQCWGNPILPTRHGNAFLTAGQFFIWFNPILPTRHGNSQFLNQTQMDCICNPILPTRHGNSISSISVRKAIQIRSYLRGMETWQERL